MTCTSINPNSRFLIFQKEFELAPPSAMSLFTQCSFYLVCLMSIECLRFVRAWMYLLFVISIYTEFVCGSTGSLTVADSLFHCNNAQVIVHVALLLLRLV